MDKIPSIDSLIKLIDQKYWGDNMTPFEKLSAAIAWQKNIVLGLGLQISNKDDQPTGIEKIEIAIRHSVSELKDVIENK